MLLQCGCPFYFAPEKAPVLHREMAWHAAQMETSVGYRDDSGVHVVPQGSAYLYLHGADSAARDLSLFAVPLVYTHPSLAKEEIALNMMITYAQDRRISYAFHGHGMLDDALGLRILPFLSEDRHHRAARTMRAAAERISFRGAHSSIFTH